MKENELKIYECDALRIITGDTLRPGGFTLTDLGVKYCNFLPGDRVLDLGCGSGATVAHLVSQYQILAEGLDSSKALLERGRKKNPGIKLLRGVGEDLPFPINCMDGVLAECTLSVMEDPDRVLEEICRVLKPSGMLVINDVYARNSEGLKLLQELNLDSCIRRALPKEQFIDKLDGHGFNIPNWTDHTDLLNQLMVDLIMTHGSMTEFWSKSSSCSSPVDPGLVQTALKQAKMGYFQLIAQKDVII